MEDRRFDGLTKTLASNIARRGLLRGVAGAALAPLLGWRNNASEAASCAKLGKKCKRSGDCCDGKCRGEKGRKRCRCNKGISECGGACCALGQSCINSPVGGGKFCGGVLQPGAACDQERPAACNADTCGCDPILGGCKCCNNFGGTCKTAADCCGFVGLKKCEGGVCKFVPLPF